MPLNGALFPARTIRNAGLRPEQQRLLLGSKDLDDYARLSTYSTQRSISLVLVECLERSRGLYLGEKWEPSRRV